MRLTACRAPAVLLAVFAVGQDAPAVAQDQQASPRQGWPCVGAVDPTYVRNAEATGGRVLMLHPSELGAPDAAAIMVEPRDHAETIVRIVGQLDEGVHEFEVPIDSTIESVDFFVSVQCLQAVSLVRPSGDELRSNDTDVASYQHFEAIRRATIGQPAPGRWTVTVAGRGLLFLVVRARTELSLSGLRFLDPGRRFEVQGHAGSLPEAGKAQRVETRIRSVEGPVAFRLISSRAATVQTLALTEAESGAGGRIYRGEATPDAAGVRLAANGVDRNGFAFQRVDPRLVVTAPR
jgi:hypothetical protein